MSFPECSICTFLPNARPANSEGNLLWSKCDHFFGCRWEEDVKCAFKCDRLMKTLTDPFYNSNLRIFSRVKFEQLCKRINVLDEPLLKHILTFTETLPTSLQPVCLSHCHPAFGRWPQCLQESRSLWSLSLAGGSAAAACQWCLCWCTDSLWNESLLSWACKDWSTRCWCLNKQGLLTHCTRSHKVLPSVTLTSIHYSSLSDGKLGIWMILMCSIWIAIGNYLGVEGQNRSSFSGSLLETKGFSTMTGKNTHGR